MTQITTIDQLEALYDAPVPTSLKKVTARLTPHYRQWIDTARFVVIATVGPEGTDASPRGDEGPAVRIIDDVTLHIPDWRGNNRIDTLRNIVRDGRISLMFMVPGSNNVVRINGTAILSSDAALCAGFEQGSRHPKSVIVMTIGEVYFQCAKAIMRSQLWSGADHSAAVPTAGQFIKEQMSDFDGDSYDAGYPEHAKAKMW